MEIWKYVLGPELGEKRIEMPSGSKLLNVQLQSGVPVLWALCDRSQPVVIRKVYAYVTGDAMVRQWPYLGTVQIAEWVSHYFDHGETVADPPACDPDA